MCLGDGWLFFLLYTGGGESPVSTDLGKTVFSLLKDNFAGYHILGWQFLLSVICICHSILFLLFSSLLSEYLLGASKLSYMDIFFMNQPLQNLFYLPFFPSCVTELCHQAQWLVLFFSFWFITETLVILSFKFWLVLLFLPLVSFSLIFWIVFVLYVFVYMCSSHIWVQGLSEARGVESLGAEVLGYGFWKSVSIRACSQLLIYLFSSDVYLKFP